MAISYSRLNVNKLLMENCSLRCWPETTRWSHDLTRDEAQGPALWLILGKIYTFKKVYSQRFRLDHYESGQEARGTASLAKQRGVSHYM